ncbi:hypothetical protein MSG28_010814 [Choristoneura fumiferana]|uniref:Uncharacterized protein n=1 Tax=Choristoneura fumiferana TaxID=7141 RepID=A0ACC0KP41_CHOFU|nr:hypothetical protein MSG28_010814 [Choristoneura fumiferana]
MKKTSIIIAILALIFNLTATDGGKDIVIVKPVLAPTSRFGAKVPETAKDFPLLRILPRNSNDIAPEMPKNEGDHQPIYVKNNNNHDVGHDIHKRNKREVLELAEGRIAQPVGVRSRDQTVIIVPNTYSGTCHILPMIPAEALRWSSAKHQDTVIYPGVSKYCQQTQW